MLGESPTDCQVSGKSVSWTGNRNIIDKGWTVTPDKNQFCKRALEPLKFQRREPPDERSSSSRSKSCDSLHQPISQNPSNQEAIAGRSNPGVSLS